MSTQAFDTFRQSMTLDYEAYHNGVGYNLVAIAAMTPEERNRAEDLVIAQNLANWRDIEALDCIGSTRALAEIKRALNSPSIEVRMHAVECLTIRQLITEQEIEKIILNTIEHTTILNGMVATLQVAKAHPTPKVRKKLLWCALHGNDDIRVHAAALVHFLYGCSSSDFDWAFRDFYLTFNTANMVKRRRAYKDLCARIGVKPRAYRR